MNEEVLEFVRNERVAVMSVMLSDGAPYSATVHFSHKEKPLKIFIQTSDDTNKAKPFLGGNTVPSSVVVGFSEEDWLTLQMTGTMRMVSPEELEEVYKVHYAKHPDAEQYKGPQTVFLEFTPTWWRYTDFNTDPEKVIES